MFNICFRIVGSQEMAEDVLQEAFVGAFQNLRSFQGKSSFGAWLKRIVVNKAISYLRKNQLEMVMMNDNMEVADSDEIDEDELVLKIASIREAVQRLPNGFRVVFSLYLLEVTIIRKLPGYWEFLNLHQKHSTKGRRKN
jgi:RNA polymerase sigma factor (sigma-70 family)